MPIQVVTSRTERRLRKLEAVMLTDASHAVPHTRKWLLYWTEIIAKYTTGELTKATLPGLIPMEALQAIYFRGAADNLDSPYAGIIRGERWKDEETVQEPCISFHFVSPGDGHEKVLFE